jgi:hypothetical protein
LQVLLKTHQCLSKFRIITKILQTYKVKIPLIQYCDLTL